MATALRSTVADFVVARPLPLRLWGGEAFVCQPPARLGVGDKPVMVVTLEPVDGASSAEWREREAALRSVAGVVSPHLLRLLETGPDPDGGGAYVACEPALGSLTAPGRPVEPREYVRAVAQAALGAHALHEAGIAHGSIHPSTILVTGHGVVLAPPLPAVTPGVLVAMSDWRDIVTMDPDLLGGQPASRPSDIWSLGATLHTLLSPRPLFPAISSEAPATAVQRILYTRPEVDPALPPSVAEVIAACLAADPADRPATAAEVAERLSQDGER